MKKILVVGYFGFGNLGDEMCLSIFRSILCDIPHELLRLTGCGGGRFSDLCRLKMSEYKAVVFIGGNLLQSATSHRSLYFYLSLIRRAESAGVPIYFLSSGIGELRGAFDRKILNKSMGRVKFFGARTGADLSKASGAVAKQIMPDLTFLLSVEKKERHPRAVYIPKDKSCLDAFLYTLRLSGLSPVTSPMFYREDAPLCKWLSEKYRIPIFIPDSAQDMINLISGSSITFSERLHGGIFSVLSNTPLVISERQEKCRDFYYELKERQESLGTRLPAYLEGEISPSVLKQELGACSSEFGIILDSLRVDLKSALNEFLTLIGEY